MSNRSCFFVLWIIFISSCSVSNRLAEENPKPDWVQSRPLNSSYYIGIGSAPKKGFLQASYSITAKQNALSDLSSEISVTIESTSSLNTISTDNQFLQQFVNDIKTSNAMQLEGYELVATWEDADNYWVYYQLSKSVYREWKIQKKQQAISEAKNKYLQANKMLIDNLHVSAFQFYGEALSLLMPYFYESTLCEINGQSIDLGSAIYNAMVSFVNNSKFDISSLDVQAKKGVKIDDNLFCFRLADMSGNSMSNIPIQINFSGSGLLKNTEKTGVDGKFCCSLQKIKSTKSLETLTFMIDLAALSRVHPNHLVRSIIKNIPISESSVRVVIKNPSLKISGNDTQLLNHFSDLLYTDFIIEKSEGDKDIDFFLNVTSDIKRKEKFNNLYYIELECVIIMSDAVGNNRYRKHIKEEYSGKSWDEATQNGYLEVMKMMERTVKREIINCLN